MWKPGEMDNLEKRLDRLGAVVKASKGAQDMPDPVEFIESRWRKLRPWQRFVIEHREEPMLIVATRQAGKTSVFAALSYYLAENVPGSLAAIVCPDQAKSETLIRRVREVAGPAMEWEPDNTQELGIGSSRIKGLPGTIKGVVSNTAKFVVFDEAGLSPRDLYEAATPMQSAVERPWMAAISSAWFMDGWFYDAWDSGTGWLKIMVRCQWDIEDGEVVPFANPERFAAEMMAERGVMVFYSPTPTKQFIEAELCRHTEQQVKQQYCCTFLPLGAAAFGPDWIAAAGVDIPPLLGKDDYVAEAGVDIPPLLGGVDIPPLFGGASQLIKGFIHRRPRVDFALRGARTRLLFQK